MLKEEIEGLDPLAGSNTMYGEDIKGASTTSPAPDREEVITADNYSAPIAPAHKVPNRSKSEQDEVAEGRVEKAASAPAIRAKIQK